MKKVFQSLACLCIALLACACNNDVQESAPETPNFYADDEVQMTDPRLQFMTWEEQMDYANSSNTRTTIITHFRGISFEFHRRNHDKTDCDETRRGLCFVRWTGTIITELPMSSKINLYPIQESTNPETGETEYYADILLSKREVGDLMLPMLNLPVEEDIVATYDKKLLEDIYGAQIKTSHPNEFAAIPSEMDYDFVVVQNNYLFDPTLGPFGGYRINLELMEK